MPQLSQDEWADLRAEWEASPRLSLAWLVASGGGHWDISQESVRLKRSREGWQKPQDMALLARRARTQVDSLSAARIAIQGDGPPPPIPTPPAPTQSASASPKVGEGVGESPELGADEQKANTQVTTLAAISDDAASEMRIRLIDRHRAEWKAARKLVYDAMKQGEAATGFEKAKFAKISTEALGNIQDGERKAWSLDADMIDFDSLTDAQLQQVANGKMPR